MINYAPDWRHTSIANGYRVVRCPDHPRAWKKGKYVYVHVVVAEQKLGRLLESWEVAHHKDGNKLNNSPENIEVKSRSEHTRHHLKDRPQGFRKAEREPKELVLKCASCEKEFKRIAWQVLDEKRSFCSKRCAGKRSSFKHGTSSAYSYRRCRCKVCKAGHAERMRKRRAAIT